METKLTLRLDEGIIKSAKIYAKKIEQVFPEWLKQASLLQKEEK